MNIILSQEYSCRFLSSYQTFLTVLLCAIPLAERKRLSRPSRWYSQNRTLNILPGCHAGVTDWLRLAHPCHHMTHASHHVIDPHLLAG